MLVSTGHCVAWSYVLIQIHGSLDIYILDICRIRCQALPCALLCGILLLFQNEQHARDNLSFCMAATAKEASEAWLKLHWRDRASHGEPTWSFRGSRFSFQFSLLLPITWRILHFGYGSMSLWRLLRARRRPYSESIRLSSILRTRSRA
jgi:hypothetical protein